LERRPFPLSGTGHFDSLILALSPLTLAFLPGIGLMRAMDVFEVVLSV
jgi:hypothetical protein